MSVIADEKNFEFNGGLKKLSIALMVVGIIAFIASFSMDKTVGWVDFLVTTLYFVTISVSGLFMLAVTGVISASWLTPYKRIPEAMTKFLPFGMVMMLAIYFGLHDLYEWTHTEIVMNDPILREKVAWLNVNFFMIRMIIIFSLWIGFATKIRGLHRQMDDGDGLAATRKLVSVSAITLIVFGLSISVASWDWVMSLEPHWFSTIYGIAFFSGSFQSGLSFLVIAIIYLRSKGYFKILTDNHIHDLGKWILGMSMFWAYMWISQYLLIWYANIPEETEYYILRHHEWNGMFWANLILNFIIPFMALLSRSAKRSSKRVAIVASVILVGHLVDLYLMAAPGVFHHAHSHVTGYGVIQVLEILGGFGLFIFVVATALSKSNIISKNDPNLAEGASLHQ